MTIIHEFTFNIPAAKIGADPYKASFSADAKALAALAKRYGIMSVDALSGDVSLRREGDGMTIAVTGHFTAKVTQACVTTLDPVKDEISETFEGWFLDESQAASFERARKRKLEIELGDMPLEENEVPVADEREEPDVVVNGQVEVGELVAQYLSLSLNPYPHSDVAIEKGPIGDEAELKKPSPFAVLKDLIKK
jgi:uncharacterized metal-binding protein YceD (DUF177 family)